MHFALSGEARGPGGIDINGANGTSKGALVKLDNLGNTNYEKPFGNLSDNTNGIAIKIDSFNRVYIAYENTLGNAGYRQAGVVIFDGASGQGLAAYLTGNSSTIDRAAALTLDAKGRIYFAGTSKIVPGSANYLVERFVQPIVAVNDTYSLTHNTTLNVSSAQGLLHNDRYVATGTTQVVTGPTHGMLSLSPAGSFSYTPNMGFQGTDTFKYHTTQHSMVGNGATVVLHVM